MWLLYALLAAILWGMDYSLSEKIFQAGIKPQTFLAAQMLAGGVIFFAMAYVSGLKSDVVLLEHNRFILWLLVAAVIIGIVANFFISLSIKAKNATIAGLIELTYPIFTVIFTWIFFHESHIKPSIIVGGLLIFVGVVVMSL